MSELIDRQALKDYVSSLSTHPLNEWDTWGVLAAIDKQPTINVTRWHRVEEPPKEEGKYLVYDGRDNYYVAWWGPRLGWCYDPKFFCYWMPIEPPKEVQDGK